MQVRLFPAACAALLLAACEAEPDGAAATLPAAPPAPPAGSGAAGPSQLGLSWDFVSSGEGVALILQDAKGAPLLRIACLREGATMTVVGESFTPIGSEERLTLGVGGEAFAFVADPTADRPSGVFAQGPAPADLLNRLESANTVSAVYGAQQIGPHIPPPRGLARNFVAECRGA